MIKRRWGMAMFWCLVGGISLRETLEASGYVQFLLLFFLAKVSADFSVECLKEESK